MAISKSSSISEHRSFRRTFLQQTEVIVKFTPALTDADFRNRMLPYAKEVFNIDLPIVSEDADHAEINADDEQKRFVFDLDQAKFIIGPETYKTFSETAIPMLGMLIQFINDVAKPATIELLSIVKINIWPIKTEDAFSNFHDMIKYTFREGCISDMLTYQFDEVPRPVRLSKRGEDIIDESTKLSAVLSAEVNSKDEAHLGLILNASTRNSVPKDILADAVTLNDILYKGFIETVSDNIIDLMSRENIS